MDTLDPHDRPDASFARLHSGLKMTRLLALAVAFGVLVAGGVGCDFATPPEPSDLVVEAFLLSGEPLPPLRLRQTRALGDPVPPGDLTADAATGASVQVAIGPDTVAYAPGETPGTYVPTESLSVAPGVPFWVEVRWEGERATASGRVPPPIAIEQTCLRIPDQAVEAILVDSLRRDSLDIPAEQGFIYPIDVTIDWPSASSAAGTWVRTGVQPSSDFSSGVVELFLQPIEVDRETDFSAGPDASQRAWMGVYAVSVDSADQVLPEHEITVSLTRGDSAFAAYATTRTDPERREPVSNVSGGVGIATSIALDTARIAVEQGTRGERCVPRSPAP